MRGTNTYKFTRKWTAILLAVCLVLCSTGAAFAAEGDEGETGIANLEYSFTAIDGSKVSAKAEGKPKVLLFYRPGCGNCRAVLNILRYDSVNPALDQAEVYVTLYAQWKRKNV